MTNDQFAITGLAAYTGGPMGEALPTPAAVISPRDTQPTRVRFGVLAFLCALSFVLYLDRVCISQAVKPIKDELNLSNKQMGFVLGAFTLAYGLFEVPTGRWGDRFGSRGVLTRIVIWWSIFTALTGAASGLMMLIAVRFLFGAGEAGALPNAARVSARWFPERERGPAQGIIVTSAQIGGAVTPFVAEYLILTLGWRWAFVLFGSVGVLWAVVFYAWYRDDPAEHPAVNEAERQHITAGRLVTPGHDGHPPIPWRLILRSRTVWAMGGVMTCGAFVFYMYISWFPTYLKEARNVDPLQAGGLASLVLTGGSLGGILGGFLGERLVRASGNRRWARSGLGFCAFALAAVALVAGIHCDSPLLATLCTALACLTAQAQLASWWAVVTDISGRHVGTMFGLMNSMGVPGALGSQLFLGFFVDWLQAQGFEGRERWDPAFYVYAVVLLCGSLCWLLVDSSRCITEPEE